MEADKFARQGPMQPLYSGKPPFQQLVENARDMIYYLQLRPERRFIYVNPAAARITGYSPAQYYAKPDLLSSIVHPADWQRFRAMLDGEIAEEHPLLMRWRRSDGTTALVEQQSVLHRDQEGHVVALEGVVREVVERAWLAEDRLSLETMDAIARLAGAVAHDINNQLTVMNLHAEILLQDLEAEDPRRENVQEILQAGLETSELIDQLLAVGGRQVADLRVVDLGELLAEAAEAMQHIVGEAIRVQTQIASELGHVRVDPERLERALYDLARHARDTMPNGGELTLSAANIFLEQDIAAQARKIDVRAPERYVEITLRDTGVGISRRTKEHLFEPFFTAQELGDKTGLRLATVYGTVRQFGGLIDVESEPGQGSAFRILLPSVSEEPQARPRRASEEPIGGTETILIVEDQESVRQLAELILRGLGYEVLTAATGAEAVQVCHSHAQPIDLLLVDVVMPEMSGVELVELLGQMGFHPRVLFTSGYSDGAISRYGILEPDIEFLEKPFSAAQLAMRVRDVLDAPAKGKAEEPREGDSAEE
ncbi:MAG: response regulator [Chloroflexi bacterium]|nr:response regulator [Chloroflexota bacterium]